MIQLLSFKTSAVAEEYSTNGTWTRKSGATITTNGTWVLNGNKVTATIGNVIVTNTINILCTGQLALLMDPINGRGDRRISSK
ncbi:hypothetical protein [Chitinophaga sp. LS1]|uniref:hypothetical protein n=1 Tax=Chitinophaga sp. LS1 TaxID=3051176 RepID=UPI002AAB8007|nr:hypothetical protein [Chitinophaga sp. LS1]WPV70544.1 hypothetical protein QQL36_17690 [Chitinophaga sp. LS1]